MFGAKRSFLSMSFSVHQITGKCLIGQLGDSTMGWSVSFYHPVQTGSLTHFEVHHLHCVGSVHKNSLSLTQSASLGMGIRRPFFTVISGLIPPSCLRL